MSFKFKDLDMEFKAEVERGKPHTFTVGEPALADKLFWVICGLDHGYTGTIKGEGVSFGPTAWNNVLALGDSTMFVRGSVRKNIYKALRIRSDRKTAKERTEEVIEKYGLQVLAGLKVKLLSDDELMTVSLARAHFRKIALVICKKTDGKEIDLQKFRDAYIIYVH